MMGKPRLHNRHHGTAPVGAVYIGRGSPYGNPYKTGDRETSCNLFEQHILPHLDVSALKGKDLVCFCAPHRCHGDSILRKANPEIDFDDAPMRAPLSFSKMERLSQMAREYREKRDAKHG